MSAYPTKRPYIFLEDGVVRHSGQDKPTRIVIRGKIISVGCTDVEAEALEYIYDHWFAYKNRNKEEVVQP